ncbi:PAS domain S-box protein [Halopelagius longus]|uniref:histidine kinase n=1 Tax=Halopelagius longus TaxID=1236180 RepID=A0A1H0XQS4_9EURY|nr:PAS domain S-box protein [Halopelagius longus]RDI72024.1 PAS domain S-box protein [Halopelagius longus]SDQ05193.1 PAS domain S-box-containing protein [Halopelagius longus]
MSTKSDATEGAFWADADDDVARRRYQTLLDTLGDGIYHLDAEGRFVAVSDELVETTGFAREELLGERVTVLLTDDDADRVKRAVARRAESESREAVPLELGVRTADGGTVPCELRVNPLLEDGEFRGSVGVVRDRSETDRPDALDSSPASPESVSTVLDEADIGVFVLDDEFRVAWADETAEEYFGLDRDDVVGRDKREVIRETVKERVVDSERFEENIRAAYADNSYIEQFEFRVTEGEGREGRWLEHYSKPIASGQYAGGRIELYYDITDRAESEDARKETEAQFRSLVCAVEEYAIVRLDAEGRVASWNEGAERIKGYDRAEIVGEHVSTFYTEEDRAAGVPERNLERATEEGVIEDEGWRVRADGSRFWANVTLTAVRGDDGTHRGYLKVTRDATEQREREQELQSELQRILSRISDAFYAVDEEFRLTHVNERAEELLQRSESELLGETLWDVFPSAAEIDDVWDAFQTARRSQEATSYELYYDTLDFWVEANLYPSETGISVYFRDVTERKKRERTLEQYEAIVETVGDGIYAVDADSRFIMVNDAFCEMVGYDREELLGEPAAIVHDESVTARAEELIEDVLDGERTLPKVEFDLRTSSGGTAPVESRISPFPDGDTYGRCGVVRDVSERAERERELEKYETIVETVEDGIYAVDADGRFTMVNEAYTKLTGYARDELLGSPVSLVVADDTAERAAEMETALKEGGVDEPVMEGEIRTADGRRVPAEATFALLPGDSRERIGVARDITERRARERALEESERRYRTLVEHFPNGAVGLFDESLTYTVAGGEMLTELGISPEEVVGTNIAERYSEELVEEIRPHFRAVFDGESRTFEVEYHGKSLLAHTLPVRNADDEVYAGMLMLQDVTERREYRRKLEESNERLEQFAYVASHDLQEPLRMVTSYLKLIERRYGDRLDEDGEEFLGFAVDGAERMREMIDGLLTYSRIETQGDPFDPVDLNDVLGHVRADLQMRIAESDADVAVERLPTVEGDASQLRQLFQNLLGNAIQYSGDEPPQVEVTAERDGESWVVSVRDEGIGIDPDSQDRIFEVFRRLHTNDELPGTGIGLALCRRIVERHGGDIRVESEPGEGATFSCRFPDARE